MKRARAWCILIAALFLGACAAVPPLPPETPQAEDILAQVHARAKFLEGLKGLAQTKVSSPAKTFSASQVLFARVPGFLRVETLSPFGTPVLYAATDGTLLNIYQPNENRYYRGTFRAASVNLGLPRDLTAEEIVSFLLGGGPPNNYEKLSIRPEREKGLWVLELLAPSREERQTLWVHPQFFYIVRAELSRPRFSYIAEFKDFQQTNEVPFPRRMLLDSPESRTKIWVEFEDLDLNPPWQPQDFLLSIPPGVAVSPWP